MPNEMQSITENGINFLLLTWKLFMCWSMKIFFYEEIKY